MFRNLRFPGAPILAGVLAISSGWSHAGGGSIGEAPEPELANSTERTTSTEPTTTLESADIFDGGFQILLPAPSAAYLLECENEPQTHYGDLTLSGVAQVDHFRCFRRVTGSMRFNSQDSSFNDVRYVGLPWLEKVEGSLFIGAPFSSSSSSSPPTTFAHILLPRLKVPGDDLIDLDMNTAVERVRVPSITDLGTLKVEMRTMSVDLSGFEVKTVDFLRLINNHDPYLDPMNPDFIDAFGLYELTEVGKLVIQGFEVDPGDDNLMNQLTTVTGNLEISGGLTELYALDDIETVGGDLIVENVPNLINLCGLTSLQNVAGSVVISAPNLQPGQLTAFQQQLNSNGATPACP